MGCDIHSRVEYKNRNGDWVCGDLFRLNPYYNADDPYEHDPYSVIEVCGERNYDLFAVLADVRNYDNVKCIDRPRGIPEDACARTWRDHNAWGVDAHSASWFTLKELIDWNEKAPAGEEGKPLDRLIKELMRRGEDLGLWYGWDSEEKIRQSTERLRFVFWFDN